jgi:hypothetical protein
MTKTQRITRFEFVIEDEPILFPDGSSETLEKFTATVFVDGQQLSYSQLYPEEQPFESEVQWFMRKATEALHTALRENSGIAGGVK